LDRVGDGLAREGHGDPLRHWLQAWRPRVVPDRLGYRIADCSLDRSGITGAPPSCPALQLRPDG
jgi:hypothetical protein